MLSWFSRVRLFVTLWTVASQAPLSMDSPGENTIVHCRALLQGVLLTQGLNVGLLRFLHWQAGSLQLVLPEKSMKIWIPNKFMKREKKVLVAQSCLTLLKPHDCSPQGSFVHRILQARILEWVAILFSRGSSWPRVGPGSPALQADSLLSEPPGKPQIYEKVNLIRN